MFKGKTQYVDGGDTSRTKTGVLKTSQEMLVMLRPEN